MSYLKEKIPLAQALLVIVIATIAISGMTAAWWSYYLYNAKKNSTNPRYAITTIQQKSTTNEDLPTQYLAECLGISSDIVTNIYALDTEKAEEALMNSPAIKEARVTKEFTETLFVEYTMYTPYALLADVENTAIDDECTPFPITPYYTAKKLPKIYLGIDDEEKFSWKKPLTMKTVPLAIDIQKILMPYHLEGIFAVLCIDTSNAYNTSYGKREIVVTLHESGSERLLRLTSEEYQQQIQNYMLLRETLSEENVAIIDMRVPQLAFFKGM